MSCTVSEFIILRIGKKKSHITSAQLKSTSQLKMRLHKKKKKILPFNNDVHSQELAYKTTL